jgi:hypothetical protein
MSREARATAAAEDYRCGAECAETVRRFNSEVTEKDQRTLEKAKGEDPRLKKQAAATRSTATATATAAGFDKPQLAAKNFTTKSKSTAASKFNCNGAAGTPAPAKAESTRAKSVQI